ncbi:MAG TPA: hypothetical protein VM778_03925 [Gemmatimonadota bacterium]|nr:hypothetical protein [Gemmatimonadota bacterium]
MAERFAPEAEISALLEMVRGVERVTVETSRNGELEGIRIEISPDSPPRQIVRDVESALVSGLGFTVDHKMIRVAVSGRRGRNDARGDRSQWEFPAQLLQHKASPALTVRVTPDRVRLRSVRIDPDGELYCRVTVELEVETERHEAMVREADTRQARLLAAGRATIAAISRTFERETAIALEGVEEFMICDEPAVIARIQSRRGLETRSFHGATLVDGHPHHAAARAVLDALNRYWTAEETTRPSSTRA